MTKALINQSLRLMSVFKKYSVTICCKEKMKWELMKEIMVERVDMNRLVYSIGIIADQRIIHPTDTHWRKYRNYQCMGCKGFKLTFQQDEEKMKKANNSISYVTVKQ